MNSLVHKFLQVCVTDIISTSRVLALVHGTVHADFKEGFCRLIGSDGNKFKKFVYITSQVPPDKGWIAFGCLIGSEFELLTDEEFTLLVS